VGPISLTGHIALGITWILDGLEVTLVGSLAGAINESPILRFTPTEIGMTASAYIAGAVLGAPLFGYLTDRLGRKRLFTVTLGVYVVATILTGISWNFWSFVVFRFLTGASIGGEYAAINSAIQEFIPARWRGFTDVAVNGSFWLVGAALGAAGSIVVLNPRLLDSDVGWRAAFVIGGSLGCAILYLRRFVPESPRWLMTHDRPEEAEKIVAEVERGIASRHNVSLPLHDLPRIHIQRHHRIGLVHVAHALFVNHRRRAFLGLTLMATQAFCYNAVFFTYALILTKFYNIPAAQVGWFILPFALGSLMGPLILGRFFDTIGRKTMISATYAISGVLLTTTGFLFSTGVLSATMQTVAWTGIFFFASAGASAAYLTVGESFPLEARALAIGIFYAFGTAAGGISGPLVFGALIESGQRSEILWGYVFGGGLMVTAAIVEIFLGIAAERRPLEELAVPLSCVGGGEQR